PVLLVVTQVPRRFQRIDGPLRQEPLRQRLYLDLERAFLAEDGLDPAEARPAEQAREPLLEPSESVLRGGALRVGELAALRFTLRVELRRAGAVRAHEVRQAL